MTSTRYYNSPKETATQDPKDRPNFGPMRKPLGQDRKGAILSGKDFRNTKRQNKTMLEIERRNKFGMNI